MPKNTGRKATKIYRNIGYNEYTGLKATAFFNTQEKRLHFLNIQKKATLFEYARNLTLEVRILYLYSSLTVSY